MEGSERLRRVETPRTGTCLFAEIWTNGVISGKPNIGPSDACFPFTIRLIRRDACVSVLKERRCKQIAVWRLRLKPPTTSTG